MAGNSEIEWTDHTFNPWWGCTKVSPGCKCCYAWNMDRRWYGANGHWGHARPRRVFGAEHWRYPLRWHHQAATRGEPYRVFCASMADVFDEAGPQTERVRLWELIRATPWLDWQLLTKRPENILGMLPADWGTGWPNVWIGVSVEDQQRVEERLPLLTAVPAVVRFLSCEPLLESIELDLAGIDWVIAGGESLPQARRPEREWFREIRDQCVWAGVPFFFKQWGEYGPAGEGGLIRLGKKRAGRLLDGRRWDEFPCSSPRPRGARRGRGSRP